MKWVAGDIDGLIFRPVAKHADDRGWLAELFRSDETSSDMVPAMCYVSVTHPGISRGPHEHKEQTDMFGFLGPGNFRVFAWDTRKDSPTYENRVVEVVGESNPMVLIIPPGVVHGYTNISSTDAWVMNFPNKLFAGKNKAEPIDEIRYEGMDDSPFSFE
ncbi:MAG: dTDP-4-dehydrorhamnose 3,5-epimerase family protein [Kiritimatiellae bacterium]|nr:dTDP-4-dehydrorhamnose 3,5-epimerase family protein [Kiritimatiellia bacterium]